MEIFTIIVTYNAMTWIDKCLTCLSKSSIYTHIIIVDNLSTDGTRKFIPQKFKDVIWLPQNKNMGFGQGNNIGINYALEQNADFIFLLNQDAYVFPNTIELLLKNSDGKSLIVPFQLNSEGKDFDYNYKRAMMKSIDPNCIFDSFVSKKEKEKYAIGETGAASWFIPRNMLVQIGGFNPLFFQYGEDNNYFQRIIYHKYSVYVVPKAHVIHDRIIQGNTEAFNRNKVRRDMLQICCNINISTVKILFALTRLLARYYIYEFPRKKYIPGTYLKESFYLLTHFVNIHSSRKEEKTKKKNWL